LRVAVQREGNMEEKRYSINQGYILGFETLKPFTSDP
jgi:hypothetical protein